MAEYMVSTAPASLINCTVGNYAVQALLGRGATSTVYLAHDQSLQRPVALKVLLGSMARAPEQLQQFRLEARATAVLQHPNIVRIFEAGVRQGIPFIAMEYVEGETLDRFLLRKGPLPWQNALHIAEQVTLALDCAHQAGIIHRDIKPSNILLDRQGRVRLTDFGIASTHQDGAAHAAAGTPEYMSPEQCGGLGPVTGASDLFSLGIMLYRMLSGRMPFSGETALGLLKSIVSDTPPRLNHVMPGLPDDVARLVAHLLEKPPQSRPASARAVMERIQRLQQENGGASALPEALNAFIREQAQPNSLRVSGAVRETGFRLQLPERRLYFVPISLAARLAAAFILLLALGGAGYWHYIRPLQFAAAPEFPAALFSGPSERQFNLPHQDWQVRALRWLGQSNVLCLQLHGRPGSTLFGERGLLAVDPDLRRATSVVAPGSIAPDPLLLAGSFLAGPLPVLPPQPRTSPLHEAFPILSRQPAAGGAQASGLTLALQHWGDAAPRAVVNLERDGPGEEMPFIQRLTAAGGTAVAPSPSGNMVAVMTTDSSGAARLILREISGDRETPLSMPPSGRVLSQSLQFSAEGKWLYLMTAASPQQRSLWRMEAAPGATPALVVSGNWSTEYGIDPSGRYAVLMDGGEDQDALVLIDLHAPTVVRPLGPGKISAECWHPTGAWFYAARESAGRDQIEVQQVETDRFDQRTFIAAIAGGLCAAPACSRDGRWLAVGTAGAHGEAVAFVSLAGNSPLS